ncbi:MAG TPA: hypothetical protein VF234_05700 [Limnochordia bacterium]
MNTFYIPLGVAPREEAWQFLQYMTTTGAAKWSNLAAEMPARTAYSRQVEWWKDRRYQQFMEYTRDEKVVLSPINRFYYERFDAETEAALMREKTPRQALADLQRAVSGRIAELAPGG